MAQGHHPLLHHLLWSRGPPKLMTKSTTRVALRWSEEASPTLQQHAGLGNASIRRSSHRACFQDWNLFLLVMLSYH